MTKKRSMTKKESGRILYFDAEASSQVEKEDLASAIAEYELALSQEFDGSYPYNRLAVIYSRNKDYANEIRVLEKAVDVYEKLAHVDDPKLARFRERLEKARLKGSKKNQKNTV